jgi:agmatinase
MLIDHVRLLQVDPILSCPKKFAVVGVPYDGATTNRPGARFGPKAIREASHMLCDGYHPHFYVSPYDHIEDIGDLTLPNTNLTHFRAELERIGKEILSQRQDQQVIWLGGDHSITLSILRCYRQLYKKPMGIIHFDAHCDTWTSHFDEPSGHGTWLYEAVQEKLVIPECIAQIGLRSSGERDTIEYVRSQNGLIYTSRELRGLENARQLHDMLTEITQRQARHGNPPLYLTLDIDCLDPSYAPGTGTPETGGLSSNQVLTILEELVPKLNFVGMDCVEVSPPYDHAELTSQSASSFVWTYLCALLSKDKK